MFINILPGEFVTGTGLHCFRINPSFREYTCMIFKSENPSLNVLFLTQVVCGYTYVSLFSNSTSAQMFFSVEINFPDQRRPFGGNECEDIHPWWQVIQGKFVDPRADLPALRQEALGRVQAEGTPSLYS